MANHSNKARPRYLTITPMGEFKSLAKAAEAEGLTPMAIVKKLDNTNNSEYYRKYPKNVIKMGKKANRKYDLDRKSLIGSVVVTPHGQFDTAKEAAEALNVSPCTITSRIKNANFSDYYRKSAHDINESNNKVIAA